eukprot:3830078-Prymnesium_polylepis.1
MAARHHGTTCAGIGADRRFLRGPSRYSFLVTSPPVCVIAIFHDHREGLAVVYGCAARCHLQGWGDS